MWNEILQEEKMNKKMEMELSNLDKEMVEREKKIIKKWKEANPHMIIGECNTPEMKALIKEWKERCFKIARKYKDEE